MHLTCIEQFDLFLKASGSVFIMRPGHFNLNFIILNFFTVTTKTLSHMKEIQRMECI